MTARVLVTGAGGFVGRTLVPALRAGNWQVREAARSPRSGAIEVGNFDDATDWTAALEQCDVVVHLAARVHDRTRAAACDLEGFRRTNRDATLHLAEAAAQAGVQRFVFLSSIKVNGEGRDTVYKAADLPEPQGAYAVSKYEAEQGLWDIAARTGLNLVIIRPPLVYGPGVGGNFRTLISLVRRGVPLPFGAVHNRRSLVGVTNLSSAISHVLKHQKAVGKTWLVSDQCDISTPELIRLIASAAGKRPMLLPIPPALLRTAAYMVGRGHTFGQIAGSLTVDSTPLTLELGWRPPLTVADQLTVMFSNLTG